MDLSEIVNTNVYKTVPIFISLGHWKLSYCFILHLRDLCQLRVQFHQEVSVTPPLPADKLINQMPSFNLHIVMANELDCLSLIRVQCKWHSDGHERPSCMYVALYSYQRDLWSQIAKVMGPTWGPSGADWTQVGPMLAPWNLLYGVSFIL